MAGAHRHGRCVALGQAPSQEGGQRMPANDPHDERGGSSERPETSASDSVTRASRDGTGRVAEAGSRAGATRARARPAPHPGVVPATCADAPSAALIHGLEQFNRHEYFECHETLEAIWNEEPGPVRVLYKGILQVGVGCYHLLRGNYRGATMKLRSGAGYLEAFEPRCMGVEVSKLIADAASLYDAVVAAGPERTRAVDRGLLPVVVWHVGGPAARIEGAP